MLLRKVVMRFSLLLTLSVFLFGNTLPVSGGETELNFQTIDEVTLEVTTNPGDIDLQGINSSSGEFTRLVLPGYHRSMEIGQPELPEVHQLIEVPHGAVPFVEIISEQIVEYSLADFGIQTPIFPAQPSLLKNQDQGSVPFVFNDNTYDLDQFITPELVTVQDEGIMRSVRIANVIIRPVDYNPVSGILKVHTNLEFVIHFDGADLELTQDLNEQYYSPVFEPVYKSLINHQRVEFRDDLVQDPITYVIIANQMFDDDLDEFIEWQTQKGYTVIVGWTDEIGSSTSAIKAFIQDLYQNPDDGVAPPSFVLFVGDVAQVPTWSGNTGSHVTDIKYCEFTNDYMPEIYLGRFSASSTAHLLAQIEKTLEYDQFTMPDPSYLGEVVMIAGMDSGHGSTWGNGQINYGTTYYFNEDHGIYSHTYLYPESGSNSWNIISNVSDGVGYINYTAHGDQTSWADPSFTISNINNLQNEHKYCLAVGNCCLTNAFDSGTCFGEAWLRAEDKGAIGYIGGSNNTYWDEDYWWGVGSGSIQTYPTYEATGPGAYDGMFHDHGEAESDWYITNYAIIMAGNLAVVQGGGNMNYYWEIYHLMGDPSLAVYLGVPEENTVTHLPILQIGLDSFTVQAEPYSYVGLAMDGVLYGAGQVDESGVIELQLTPILTAGTATVVVTRQNLEPYIGYVEVGNAEGPYVIIDEYLVSSDSNGNGVIDYGEAIELTIMAENVGAELAANVSATVICDDPYITLNNDSVTFDDIEAGAIEGSLETISFTVSNETPDGYSAGFDIHFVSDTDIWSGFFTIDINAYCVLGDVNADWAINVMDIVATVNFVLNSDEPTELEACAADVNEDGIINIIDIIIIINFIVGDNLSRVNGAEANTVEFITSGKNFSINSDGEIAGIQLTVKADNITLNESLPLQIVENKNGDEYTILVYSQIGATLPAGENVLFSSTGDFEITSSIVVNSINEEILAETAKTAEIPGVFALHQNYPNPFNPSTSISFEIPENGLVTLVIHDLMGREIVQLINSDLSAGYNTVVWNGTDVNGMIVPTGMYIYTVTTGNESISNKLVFMK